MRLIDADALKKDIVAYKTMPEIRKAICDVIDNATTVEEKSYAMGFQDGLEEGLQDMRPQGEWIRKGDSKWHCSNCGAVPEFDGTTNTDKFNVTMSNKYCRLCGANMRKGDNNDT